MFEKIQKPLLVIFITALIWIWADLSLDETLYEQTVVITAGSSDPALWASFENQNSVRVKADLEGPASKIADLVRAIESSAIKLEVKLDVDKEKISTPGEKIDVVALLQNSRTIKETGLKIKAAAPAKIEVDVIELEQKNLTVRCLDENRIQISKAQISPAVITMPAPKNWTADMLKADVILSDVEQKQARGSEIEKSPTVELPGKAVVSETAVKVKLPSAQQRLNPYTISGTLGYLYSANWDGRYKIELLNEPEILNVQILATAEAKDAYEVQNFEILLEINDKDIDRANGEITRRVVYNFPKDFVVKDAIRLNQEPAAARFRISYQPELPAPGQ